MKAVKAYAFTQLQSVLVSDPTSPALTLGVFYDDPGTSKPSDMVLVAGVQRTVEVSAMVGDLGAFSFEDTWLFDVDVVSYRNTPRAAFERACDLVEQVIAWQRGDPTMGGLLVTMRPIQVDQPQAASDDNHKGYLTLHTVKFFCRSTY